MIRIDFVCETPDAARAFRDKCCTALAGCEAFVQSDIIVGDHDTNNCAFYITMGDRKGKDVDVRLSLPMYSDGALTLLSSFIRGFTLANDHLTGVDTIMEETFQGFIDAGVDNMLHAIILAKAAVGMQDTAVTVNNANAPDGVTFPPVTKSLSKLIEYFERAYMKEKEASEV